MSEPGALNYYTLFRLILLTLSVSRNLTLTCLSLSGSLDSLLCDLIAPTSGLAFSFLISYMLVAASLFRLISLLALLVGLNLFFLIGVLGWIFKITKVIPFESANVFRKDPFLALYFSLFLLMIFLLCLRPSAALVMLMFWPFGPPLSWFLLWWRLHKEL